MATTILPTWRALTPRAPIMSAPRTSSKKELARQKEFERRCASVTKTFSLEEATGLVQTFKKKAVRRLKVFHEESQKMDKKFVELVQKAESLGVKITSISKNSVFIEDLKNYRKKSKSCTFDVEAMREGYLLNGVLGVTPASMHLELNCYTLKQPTTQSGFPLPLLKITYYRTLNVRDNWLPALVAGHTKEYKYIDGKEIPF